MKASVVLSLLLFGFAVSGEVWGMADVSVRSGYLFRGVMYVDAPVLEPSMSLGTSDLSVTLWGSMELTDENDYGDQYGTASGEFTEVDLILDYTRDLGTFWVYGGIGKYWYPNTGYESSSELYLAAGPNIPLSPAVSLYRDLEGSEGLYASLSLTQCIPLRCLQPEAGLNLGYGNRKHNLSIYGVERSAVADLTMSLAVPLDVSGTVTVTPSARFSILPDSEISDGFESSTHFVGGLSITWGFLQ